MNDKPTHIDLFAGIGGFSLAAQWAGFETVVFCEKDEFCQKVLESRFGGKVCSGKSYAKYSDTNGTGASTQTTKSYTVPDAGRQNNIPIIPDIRDFDGTRWRGATLLTGGFPCQDISVGNTSGQGIYGTRSGLWVEICRVIGEARPGYALVENSSNLLKRGLGGVLWDLAEIGYDAEWHCIPASHVGAPHIRDRIWLVAYPRCKYGGEGLSKAIQGSFKKFNAHDYRQRFRNGLSWDKKIAPIYSRMANGIPDEFYEDRKSRLKALGNAIVPAIAYEIIRCIRSINDQPNP